MARGTRCRKKRQKLMFQQRSKKEPNFNIPSFSCPFLKEKKENNCRHNNTTHPPIQFLEKMYPLLSTLNFSIVVPSYIYIDRYILVQNHETPLVADSHGVARPTIWMPSCYHPTAWTSSFRCCWSAHVVMRHP